MKTAEKKDTVDPSNSTKTLDISDSSASSQNTIAADVLCSRVSDSELKILKALWKKGSEMKLSEIRKMLTRITGWEAVMVKTLLYRLVDKGVVKSDKREVFYFTPLIREQDYSKYATNAFVDKIYDGSVKSLVASLIDCDQLNDQDIQELHNMFQMADKHE